jgi:1-acyl-sn-glycerol-3-phosphate acyltransferase
MIDFKNNKNRFLIYFFRKYFYYSLKRNFNCIKIKGRELLEEKIRESKSGNIPVIFIFNHPNWWDAAFVVHFSYNYLKMDGFCLMEYKQMADFKFFNKIGAVPIIRQNARYSLNSIKFVANSVRNTSKIAVIFPQAELTHNSKRPYRFYSGFDFLIKDLDDVYLICGYLDYRFTLEQRPEIFIYIFDSYRFDKFNKPEKKTFINFLERKYELINSEFEKEFISDKLFGYDIILKGRKSISSVN